MKHLRLLVLLALVGILLLAGCSSGAAPTGTDETADSGEAVVSGEVAQPEGADGTVIIRNMGNLTSFNPMLTSDGASIQARRLLWPPLVGTDNSTGAAVQGLQTWEVSDDALTYTFHIRDDAVWSDGEPITSADVKFVIEAIQSPVETVVESEVENIASVNIIDDKNYELVLSKVDCGFLSGLAGIRLLPAHKYAADFSDFESSDFNLHPDISGAHRVRGLQCQPDLLGRRAGHPAPDQPRHGRCDHRHPGSAGRRDRLHDHAG
jgi:peptide/nickel transport system substrate-binding protein